MYLLLDRTSGKVVDISLWDSKEDAASYVGTFKFREDVSQLDDYLAGTTDGEGYEVSVDA